MHRMFYGVIGVKSRNEDIFIKTQHSTLVTRVCGKLKAINKKLNSHNIDSKILLRTIGVIDVYIKSLTGMRQSIKDFLPIQEKVLQDRLEDVELFFEQGYGIYKK